MREYLVVAVAQAGDLGLHRVVLGVAGARLGDRRQREAADNTIARIIRMVEEAESARAPTERFITRFSRWYMPLVVGLAALVMVVPPILFGQPWGIWVYRGLALLLIGCPCALVISVPAAIASALSAGARHGLLMKGGAVVEAVAGLRHVALDKTGTLTEGKPSLVEVLPLAGVDRKELLHWTAIAESGSDHPLGRPIIEAARAEGALPSADTVEELAGMGLVAEHDGRRIAAGNRRLFGHLGIGFDAPAEAALADVMERGRTPVIVALDGKLAGILGLSDQPRAMAAAAMAELRRTGINRIAMLTGDQPLPAQAIAAEIGIDEVHAALMPEDKLALIRQFQAEGHHVAMIGDGINDAPALAAADTSIAMGAAGTDVAIETADIALMADDLLKLPEAIAISRATLRNMRQNLVIALLTVVGLLAGVFSGDVHMASGMLIHQLSVLIVIANAMRLMRRPRRDRPGSQSRPLRPVEA